jgi:hypothetical protein
LAIAITSVLLAGCSLPFTGQDAPPIVPQTGRELTFTTYHNPDWGYTIAIPEGASVRPLKDGRITTLAYADDTIVRGEYVTQVEVVPEIGHATPTQLLQEAAARLVNPPAPTEVRNADGSLTGAQLTFETSKGEVCEKPNAVMAAYVVGQRGYLVRVTSDGLNRCDTAALPETQQVIKSFRASS